MTHTDHNMGGPIEYHTTINIFSLITALRFAAIKFVGCKLGQNKVSHLRILGQQNEGL
jgi:hypothetical protein